MEMSTATRPGSDLTGDAVHPARPSLDALFAPRAVAVIGATDRPGSLGRTVLWNLISTPFGGTVFPINPRRPSVLGVKAYPRLTDVPDPVDLAIIVTPEATAPALIDECVERGVRGAIVISAGFKETGPAGEALERELLARARRGPLRLIGPNCLGVMRPPSGLNATFASDMALPGSVGFISQSGALCASILDWSLEERVGFSAFISVGTMLDVGWGDLIDYLGDDPSTQSILLYMETIGDARSFLSAAREVALRKPIVVIKAGRTEAAARAAASHTGALTGSDEALAAAFRRCGVLQVSSVAELFNVAEVLAKQPRPRGPRLTVVTNSGGPGVLVADALTTAGGELAPLAPETMAALNEALPAHWSRGNPIDILGDATPERYEQALAAVARDPGTDGMLVMLTPTVMADPARAAERVAAVRAQGKPLLASWMGGARIAAGEALLNRAGIPTFRYPEAAARAFQDMWRYTANLRDLYETPSLPVNGEAPSARAAAARLIQGVREAGRALLTEAESKELLASYGIPVVETRTAASADEAVAAARAMGFPVALKLWSATITHKSDVGGVRLNLAGPAAVRRAFHGIEAAVEERAGPGHFLGVTVQPMAPDEGYELIVGSSVDDQLGPVLLFGAGGQLVEVLGDRAIGLPPLNSTLARRLMERTRIYQALKGVRGRAPADMAALEELLVRFSHLVAEQRWVKAIDINPLSVSAAGPLALDARVLLHDPALDEAGLPRLAIRPYPSQYVAPWTLPDGEELLIRPIRPEDETLLARFHATLSEQTVEWRYFHPLRLEQRVDHERLSRVCFNDYDRELALIVERSDPERGGREIIAVGRLSRLPLSNEAEFAIVITDRYQRRGLGSELLRRLVEIGRAEGVGRVIGVILTDNYAMQRVCKRLGFRLHRTLDNATITTAEIDLG
jgi:acetyltransferase